MAFNIFRKKDTEVKSKSQAEGEGKPIKSEGQEEVVAQKSAGVPIAVSQGAHEVIKSFYASEKASRLMGMNQYVFRVASDADKQSIKKHISALYKVKIKNVQVLNMPEKSRNVGKFAGTKSGFRKAIVTLEKGSIIEQAKP
ncbi:MAG: 50S ribosomal protein L23 [Patescibacteria group bacterium]